MKTYLLLLLLLPISSWAQVKGEISGNVEAQTRHTWNNEAARDDLAQDWEEENFHLVYGNLNGKLQFKGSRLESNVFARHSQSDL